mmetsp:Transcript_22653/g.46435  ORF Transcript_22653/g.46435 Transcript_22653/m.46435 type:complete len:532 (+) Transcript_22653:32-1627(+)
MSNYEWNLEEIASAKDVSPVTRKIELALNRAGLGEDACIAAKTRMLADLASAFGTVRSTPEDDALSRAPVAILWVPGRIEVAGKHTDYAGGRSLLCAVPRGLLGLVRKRTDQQCRVVTLDHSVPPHDRVARFGLEDNASSVPPFGHWSRYMRVALQRLARDFPELKGVDIAIASDLPGASGMSTSSALVCLAFLSLDYANSESKAGLPSLRERAEFLRSIPDDLSLFEYLGCLENGKSYRSLTGDAGVGTFGGSEDHTAIMCSHRDELRVFSFCPTFFESKVAFPVDQFVFVVGVSGVLAEKTGSANADYNSAAAQASACARRLGCATLGDALSLHGGVASCKAAVRHGAFDATSGTAAPSAGVLDARSLAAMTGRLEQFASESEEVVPGLATSISTGDASACGCLSATSQRNSEVHLGNIVEATRWLPSRARHLGACAASAFGAGFGGSVWALVEVPAIHDHHSNTTYQDSAAAADEHSAGKLVDGRKAALAAGSAFAAKWREDYVRAFPENATRSSFFAMLPAPGACRV